MAGCPFYQVERDGSTEKIESVLLPFFRSYQLIRLQGKSRDYNHVLRAFNKYLQHRIKYELPEYQTYIKHLTNFHALFHPSKVYDTLLPYFPYRHDVLMGCSEAIIRRKEGIRVYCYSFQSTELTAFDMDYYGFKLQLASRVFHIKTGLQPSSMALVLTNNRHIVYYTYNPEEKIEEMIHKPRIQLRKYGSYCSSCMRSECRPLIDTTDHFGWRQSERKGI